MSHTIVGEIVANVAIVSVQVGDRVTPTDTLVLTRWAKLMMMLQAAMAFGTVILLTARAVNLL